MPSINAAITAWVGAHPTVVLLLGLWGMIGAIWAIRRELDGEANPWITGGWIVMTGVVLVAWWWQ